MKKFVIFGLGRSGSTLLASLLNTHPAIQCDGELFNRDRWPSWRRPLYPIFHDNPVPHIIFRQVANRYLRHVISYGFKLQLGQIKQPGRILSKLQRAGWHILYLQRLSLFDQIISAQVARHTHRYHTRVGSNEPETTPLVIDPNRFRNILQTRQERIRQCQAIAASLPHLPLVYEQDLQSSAQWNVTIARICDYLGLEHPSTPVTSHLKKTWSRPYSEIVTNYAELRDLAHQQETDAC